MRQALNDILCVLALAPFAAIIGYCFFAEDPVMVEIGRAAEAEARPYVLEQQRACAADILRPIYAVGEPTPEQVEAAYRDCE
jgi:hypothetical protein